MFDKHPITSLLQTDMYKFTMQQFVLHQFPKTIVKFEFKCRTPNINLGQYAQEIRDEILHVSKLKFQKDELDYLRSLSFLTDDYIDFLENFQLKTRHVKVYLEDVKEGDIAKKINIEIEGSWFQTILWEVPILKIVHEVYSKNEHPEPDYDRGLALLRTKIMNLVRYNNIKPIRIADFGSRRAFSSYWHDIVVKTLKENLGANIFTGTSNVKLAKDYQLTVMGTMAHEIFQACQGMDVKVMESQKLALDKWSREFRGDLGIALTDTLGMDKFLKDFDMYFAKLFDGVRHDSGDPIECGNKIIAHYKSLGIDPVTKTVVFSDGLNVPKAMEINDYFFNKIKVAFGIGTNLTNDLGYPFLQIVIKMVECNGFPVAKISDNPIKTMSNNQFYIQYLKDSINQELNK